MANILFFYPDNPNLINQGNNARARFLLEYFKSQNFNVDLVGEKRYDYSLKDQSELKENGYINDFYFITRNKNNGLKYLFTESIPKKLKDKTLKEFNKVRPGQQKQFNTFIKEKKYDYILISYLYWLPLIENNPFLKNAKIIVDTHDFLTSQFKNKKKFNIGKGFQQEIKLLKSADAVWAISDEENYLFSQFLQKPVYTIPHGAKNNSDLVTKPKYDIFYVASNNPHNLKSSNWFFSEVYPLLNKNISICVVGRVNQTIEPKENIHQIDFVEDLSSFYKESKVTICPMLSGTGLKIKVVESLSYGIPVVGNTRAADGLPNKINNGCIITDDAKEFAKAINTLLNNIDYYKAHSQNAISMFKSTFEESIVFNKLNQQFTNS